MAINLEFKDYLGDNLTFDDINAMLDQNRADLVKNTKINIDLLSEEEIQNILSKQGIKNFNKDTFSMSQAFEALNLVNEAIDFHEVDLKSRSFKLKHGLRYSSVKEMLAGREVLTHIFPALDPRTLLNYYTQANYITENNLVFFPKGTVFDFKDTAKYNDETYFILATTNNPDCLIAVSTKVILNLFDR